VTETSDPPGFVARARPLAPIYISIFLFTLGESALHVIVPPYVATELGAKPAVVGVVVGIFAFASLLSRMPVGATYSVQRARLLVLAGGGLSAGAFALVPLVEGVVPFGALMALDGIGWATVTTTQLALMVAAKPRGLKTAEAMGWYSGATGLGHSVAGALGGFLADTVGFDSSFFVLAAITAFGTAVMFGMVSRTRKERLREVEEVGRKEQPMPVWRYVRGLPAIVWAGALVMVYINLLNGVVQTFQPILALGAGLSLTQIGILASCRSWASSSSRLGSGPLFARISADRLTTPLVLLGAMSLMAIPIFRSSFLLQIPLFLAMGLSRGLLRVTGSAQAFDNLGGADREHGVTAALLHSGLDLGKVSGPVIGGVVAQVAGVSLMFWIVPLSLVFVYFMLLLAAARRQVGKKTEDLAV
jgi:predicted MFS family arabinose efflux permease